MGGTITLINSTPGGTWTSCCPWIATVNSITGVVTGMAEGNATITYSLTGGCITTTTVHVNPYPGGIIIPGDVCAGHTITLVDLTPGGTWSSGNITIATIGSLTGTVNGLLGGTASVTYTLPTGCFITSVVNVNPLPATGTITGTTTLCVGGSATLTDAAGSGVWSSSNSAVCTVSTAGVITGISAGTTTISLSFTNSCGTVADAIVVTVYMIPPIIGTAPVCQGSTISLDHPIIGGTCSSCCSPIATVSTGGVVTGMHEGDAIITYTLSSGCFTTTTVHVNPYPAGIIIPGDVCVGSTITLIDFTPGGTWSITGTTIATIAP